MLDPSDPSDPSAPSDPSDPADPLAPVAPAGLSAAFPPSDPTAPPATSAPRAGASAAGSLRSRCAHALARHAPRLASVVAITALVVSMGGTWVTAGSAVASPLARLTAATEPDAGSAPPARSGKRGLTGKLNLNTATVEQLVRLPSIGPAKAERIVEWRRKHGAFKRIADLRRVKGFGYKTFKKLAPFLDVRGETTLAAAP